MAAPEWHRPNKRRRRPPDQLTFERTTINLALSHDENAVSGNRPGALRLRPLHVIAPK
jgi:hypothetical protein